MTELFEIGDAVMIDSYEGFGGPATIVEARHESPTNKYKVAMHDGSQRPFWAHDFEVSALGEPSRGGYDSRVDTRKHVREVQARMERVIADLGRRQQVHDLSKFTSPEREVFDEMTPKLAATTYGSDEYKGYLAEMKVALDHHYAVNGHHPEHYPEGRGPESDQLRADIQYLDDYVTVNDCRSPQVERLLIRLKADLASKESRVNGMSLFDVVEMLCDWKAATLRRNDGDIRKSIEINQKRFGYSDELKQILLNSLCVIEAEAPR